MGPLSRAMSGTNERIGMATIKQGKSSSLSLLVSLWLKGRGGWIFLFGLIGRLQ